MIKVHGKKLFGIADGILEYVSQRVETRYVGLGHYQTYMIIKFTDHDLQANPLLNNEDLVEGKYYELEFPISCD